MRKPFRSTMGCVKQSFKVVCKYTNSEGNYVEETRIVQAFNKSHAINSLRGPMELKEKVKDLELFNEEKYSQPLPPLRQPRNSQ